MVVIVDTRNLVKFGKKLELLTLNFPEVGKRITKEMSEDIAEGMRERVNVWHGNLKGSITTEEIEDGNVVKAAFYGKFLESGHKVLGEKALEKERRFGIKAKVSPKFMGWAREKAGSVEGGKFLINALIKTGVKPHPFIEPAIKNTINKFEVIAGKEIKIAIKKAGIGTGG